MNYETRRLKANELKTFYQRDFLKRLFCKQVSAIKLAFTGCSDSTSAEGSFSLLLSF